MPTTITCPHCNVTLKPKTPPSAGARVKCPKCQTPFLVPAEDVARLPAAGPTSGVEKRGTPKPKRAAEEPDEEVEGVAEAAQDDEADAPKTKRKGKKKQKVPVWVWIAAGIAGLFLLCGCGGGVTIVVHNMAGGGGLFGPTITMSNFKKLKRGMTEDDVKKVLGTPTTRVVLAGYPNVVWEGRGGDYITVVFGPDGKSVQAHYQITQGAEVLKAYVDLP